MQNIYLYSSESQKHFSYARDAINTPNFNKMLPKLIFIAFFATFSDCFIVDDIKSAFGPNVCIPGSLSSIDLQISENLVLKESEDQFKSTLINTTSSFKDKTIEDKSVLSKLNELVQYNEISYVYKLEKEEGPPHDRVYTVSLKIGDEVYEGEGKSLKMAQRSAAALALEETSYLRPPVKETVEETILTPTVLLNNLCMKLGLPVQYSQVDAEKQGGLHSNVVVDGKKKKSYIQKLNESIFTERHIRTKKDIAQNKGPFRIAVQVNDNTFYGVSNTIQSAKHIAASKAIEYLYQNKDKIQSNCLGKEDSQECSQARQNLKSPISLVYEAAQVRQLEIEFEIIDETGPAHRKTFVTQCRIGELTTVGEGKSKKASKKAAAESMLERIPELPSVSTEMQTASLMKDKKKRKKKKKKIIKTKLDEVGLAIENMVDSVWSFGQDSKGQNQDDLPGNKGPNEKKKPKHLKKSFQDQILELGNFLSIEVQYTDFQETNQHHSILSVLIDPEHICFGSGSSESTAREQAADGALDLLYSMGLYDHFDNPDFALERETKEAVRVVMNQGASEDSEK